MADKPPVVHIGENSPEEVAYKRFEMVARVETRSTGPALQEELKASWTKADRKWILDTYAECLDAVKGSRLYVRTA